MKNITSSKRYFGYIRVSTARQGHSGTSLIEQRSAIHRYAQHHSLSVIKEFEEQETAAKAGRPVFRQMISALKQKRASGIIIHKIDRSARNLKDWAELGELIDAGVEVHFANENLDLYSRGGRLSADIQAVVAADYIRNLKEEVKKGFYGRIKQGFYPMPAPLGYLNRGAGRVKTLDPEKAPLIKLLFELYASGNFGIRSLTVEINRRGLQNKAGRQVSINGVALILHNLFYIGIIYIKRKGEYFVGKHEPLISKQLFDQVQQRLSGKLTRADQQTPLSELFLFRRLLTCSRCKRHMIGERHKTYLYYRCHTPLCEQITVRSEVIDAAFAKVLQKFQFTTEQTQHFEKYLLDQFAQLKDRVEEQRKSLRAELSVIQNKLLAVTDSLITGLIDERLFVIKKNELLDTELSVQERLNNTEADEQRTLQELESAFHFAQTVRLDFEKGDYGRKRQIISKLAAEIVIVDKDVALTLQLPFETLLQLKQRQSL